MGGQGSSHAKGMCMIAIDCGKWAKIRMACRQELKGACMHGFGTCIGQGSNRKLVMITYIMIIVMCACLSVGGSVL